MLLRHKMKSSGWWPLSLYRNVPNENQTNTRSVCKAASLFKSKDPQKVPLVLSSEPRKHMSTAHILEQQYNKPNIFFFWHKPSI